MLGKMNAIEELERLLPHRRPMIMLAEPLPEEERGVAAAYIDSSEGSIFYDPEIDGVPSCAALEFMAQTMAVAVGRYRIGKGLDPAVGFVLGTRKMDVATDGFSRRKRYMARAACTYADGEFASFDCSIRDVEDDAVVASATLTAFQPDDLEAMEKMI